MANSRTGTRWNIKILNQCICTGMLWSV